MIVLLFSAHLHRNSQDLLGVMRTITTKGITFVRKMEGSRRLIRKFKEFLEGTTIHGCRYTVDTQFQRFENAIWTLIVIIFLIIGSVMVTLSSISWNENPVATTIESVTHPLVQIENFPTVTMCPKQTKFVVDEWGIVKNALIMIEMVCIEDQDSSSKCQNYLEQVTKLRNKAKEKMQNIDDLPLDQVVMLAKTKGEGDEDFLKYLYLIIAKIFNQEKVTPMAIVKMAVRNKGTKLLEDVSVKMLLDDNCNFIEAEKYAKAMKKHEPICIGIGEKSPCCGYFSSILSANEKMLDLAHHIFKYAVPNLIETHEPLAQLLGLPYDHDRFWLRTSETSMLLVCRIPHGEKEDCTKPPVGFDILWTPVGYCVTFNEQAPSMIYQESEWLQRVDDIFRYKKADAEPWWIKGAGDKYSFRAVMTNFGQMIRYPYADQKDPDSIKFLIAERGIGFANKWKTMDADPKAVLLVTESLMVIRSDAKDLKDVPLEKRQCKFPDEIEGLRIFKQYSGEACELENMIQYAIDSCGFCIPWNMPFFANMKPGTEKARLCDAYEHNCMNHYLDDINYKVKNATKCYKNCNLIKMDQDSLRTSSQDDIQKYCEEGEFLYENVKSLFTKMKLDNVKKAMEDNELSSKLISDTNMTFDEEDIEKFCAETYFEDTSSLLVQMAIEEALLFKRGLRLTFTDKIAAFGTRKSRIMNCNKCLNHFQVELWVYSLE